MSNIICPDCKEGTNHSNVGLIVNVKNNATVGEFLKCKRCGCVFKYEYNDLSVNPIIIIRPLR